MRRNFCTAAYFLVGALVPAMVLSGEDGRWVHPGCKPLGIQKNGPFVLLEDGSLLLIDGKILRTSQDDGKSWTDVSPPIDSGMRLDHVGHVGQFLRTRKGSIVVLYLDFNTYKFSWDNERGEPRPDCKLELWAIRSTDGGKSWVDRQLLLGGYNADFMGLIQTRNGQIVATVEHLAPELKRWLACSFVSGDEGKSWRRSNWIDLGGHGHHDGATEPMVAELRDGRLLMLIRTSLDQFWKAYSDDGGRYWRVIQPSGIDASSAPGWLLRLKSGRLVLAWNRFKPEGRKDWQKDNWSGPAFEFPASMHREELSIAFSGDDGETWTDPVAIAREPGGQLSYPYIMERRPGELWVFTRYTFHRGSKPAEPLAVSLREDEFVSPSQKKTAQ